jgi:anti-sigma-K factor RskA
MTPAHDQLKEDAAAYVLGSLDPQDQQAFEAHLPGCAECAEEVRSLRAVTAALAAGAPQRTPRPELRNRVLGSLPGVSAGARAARPGPRLASWLPVAASLVLTAGAALYAARLQTRVSDLEVRLQQAILQASAADQVMADARRVAGDAQSAMAVLAAPDVARIDLAGQAAAPQARARALWSRDRGMVFTASNLPALPAGRVYQVWVVTPNAPVSAGLLMPDANGGGSVYFSTPSDIATPVALAVTLEPAGGVPAPTNDNYFLLGKPAPL